MKYDTKYHFPDEIRILLLELKGAGDHLFIRLVIVKTNQGVFKQLLEVLTVAVGGEAIC